MNYIEQLEQTLEEVKRDSTEYTRLDELLDRLNRALRFEETLERIDELIAK